MQRLLNSSGPSRGDPFPPVMEAAENHASRNLAVLGKGMFVVILHRWEYRGTFRNPRPEGVQPGIASTTSQKNTWPKRKSPRCVSILVGRAQAPVWDASANHHLERKKPMPHVVGFGEEGVFVALGNGDGKVQEPHKNPVLDSFATNKDGAWISIRGASPS